jgi:hypothetical protein
MREEILQGRTFLNHDRFSISYCQSGISWGNYAPKTSILKIFGIDDERFV